MKIRVKLEGSLRAPSRKYHSAMPPPRKNRTKARQARFSLCKKRRIHTKYQENTAYSARTMGRM